MSQFENPVSNKTQMRLRSTGKVKSGKETKKNRMQEGLAQERKQGRRYSDCKIGKGEVSSSGN